MSEVFGAIVRVCYEILAIVWCAFNAVSLIGRSVYTEMNSTETLFLHVDCTPSGDACVLLLVRVQPSHCDFIERRCTWANVDLFV